METITTTETRPPAAAIAVPAHPLERYNETHGRYTEMHGHKPFNWIHALESVRRHDGEMLQTLHYRATQWPLCACGNQCAVIPREEGGRPLDQTLSCLGSEFPETVMDMCHALTVRQFERARGRALACVRAIDERALEILREMGIDA